jgi:hypothetical protein
VTEDETNARGVLLMLSFTESRIRLAFVTRIVLSEPSGNRDERAFLTQT